MAQKLALAERHHLPQVQAGSQASSSSEASLLRLRLMRYARLSASRNDSTGLAHAARLLVSRDLPDGDYSHGNRIEASRARSRLRLQNGVAHDAHDPRADD